MDARQLKEMSERLRQARVIRTDIVSGFYQLPIDNQSISQAFSSPLPNLGEKECVECSRHQERVVELERQLAESEQGRAKAKSQAQALQLQLDRDQH